MNYLTQIAALLLLQQAPAAKIIERKHVDAPGVPRLSVKMIVPAGMTRGALTNMLSRTARAEQSTSHAMAVMVFAYTKGSSLKWGFTAGKCEFAPSGDWGRAREGGPIEQYKAKIEFARDYRFRK